MASPLLNSVPGIFPAHLRFISLSLSLSLSGAMVSKFQELPPSKRFKLLHKQDSAPELHVACLPAKKRIESHRIRRQPDPLEQEDKYENSCNLSYRLPAKKRILAPNPFLPIHFDVGEDDLVCEPSPKKLKISQEPDELTDLGRPEAAMGEIGEEEDDGVICAVCKSTDGNPQDPIVFCDGCDLMVHASCYGNPLINGIPEGDWFCKRCENKREKTDCCLCTAKGGATKPTTDGRWAHILCALLVPEAFFHDPDGREGLDLSRVPERRWKGKCCICESSSTGCVIDCSEARCGLGFHASCAVDADLCVEYREGRAGGIVVGFCQEHTLLWKKQQATGKFKFVPQHECLKGKTTH